MKKTISPLDQIRDKLLFEIKDVLEQYRKSVWINRVGDTLNISNSYLSQIKTGSDCRASLAVLLEIAEKLGMRYEIVASNLNGVATHNVTVDKSDIPYHINKITGGNDAN